MTVLPSWVHSMASVLPGEACGEVGGAAREMPLVSPMYMRKSLPGRSYAVKAGFFWDSAEFFFVCSERYPRGPGEGAPGGGQVGSIVEGYFRFLLVGIRRHA